jgi:hypothetical protein
MILTQNVIAIVSDFDDTLTDDSTTQLLRHYNVDPEDFWERRVDAYIRAGSDPTIAFLQAVFDLTAKGGPLRSLTNAALRKFGGTLALYSGLPKVIEDLRAIAGEFPGSAPTVEFYVISGGFEEIILGSPIAQFLTHCWGCRCADGNGGKAVARMQNVIDFTTKTRCLFEINKGVAAASRRNPFLVNEAMSDESRRVPFSNIIYLGDGLTDVAAFSLVQARGGTAFAVCNPDSQVSAKRTWWKFMKRQRTAAAYTPRYQAESDLGKFLRLAVRQICERLEANTAY